MLDYWTICGIGAGLAMDAFAVAIATSVVLRRVSPRQVFRFSFHFGLFQALMPLLGYFAGSYFEAAIRAWDHWVAFGLLGFVGLRTIHEALTAGDDRDFEACDPTRGMRLVVLSVATSIDALAVGFSFAVIQVRIWHTVLIIGVITAILTTLGMLFGSRLGQRFGRGIEMAGGLVLIIIGTKILIEHTLL